MAKRSGPMLAPRSGGPARQVIVLLHGYGADGSDLIGLGHHWGPMFPDALFVAPNAPTPAQSPASNEPKSAAASPPIALVATCVATGSAVVKPIATEGHALMDDNTAITNVVANTMRSSFVSTR